MTKEDINFLISIQSLPDEEFQIAYLERELDKKENIIKEVRKYIKNHREAVDERAGHIIYILKDDFDEEDILKILGEGE